ncbi:MAG: isoamylase early set domain-containing protein [Colwellia sp.]
MLKKKSFKTKNETEITFEFSREDADSVALVAEFNDWQPVSMNFNKKDRVFRTKVRLPKDKSFHFRYLINEQEWENDHQADDYISNPFGSDNSVVVTPPI